MCSNLKNEKDLDLVRSELSYLANTYYSKYKPTKNTLKKHKILKKLKDDPNIVITRPDKGNGVVILDRKDYISQMLEIFNDRSKFKVLDSDPTIYREGQLQRRLLKLKKKGFFSDDVYSKVYPTGSKPARAYGLPKLHKAYNRIPKFRPIVSTINSFNSNLASFLSDLVNDVIPMEHSSKDTFTFLSDLHKVNINDNFMISYDVTSLFTNIPLEETVDLAVKLILDKNSGLKITRKELKELFIFCTSKNNFIFNGIIYDQTDGISMGSPLAPSLANLFMGYNEKLWLNNYKCNPLYFTKDTLMIFLRFFTTKSMHSIF